MYQKAEKLEIEQVVGCGLWVVGGRGDITTIRIQLLLNAFILGAGNLYRYDRDAMKRTRKFSSVGICENEAARGVNNILSSDRMGKTKRTKGSKLNVESTGRAPALAEQILDDSSVKTSVRSKVRKRKEGDDDVSIRTDPLSPDPLMCNSPSLY